MHSLRVPAIGLVTALLLSGCIAGTDSDATGDGDVSTMHDPVCQSLLNGIDLHQATILDLQTAMEEGRLTSVELVQAYLDRIAAFDDPSGTAGPGLNSIIHLNPDALDEADALDMERAAGQVRGPLHGMPILLKDNVGTNDMPTTAGSIALALNIPPEDATLTERLREAGAIILGKANLSEFANWVSLNMPNGYSSHGGQTKNAHHYGDPLGSSAGSGVAASMALAAGTIGTETSGSILSPSWANSVVGLKPTTGLIPRTGIIPLAHSFDTAGPMVRHVADAAVMLGAMAGADLDDPRSADSDAHLPPGSDYTVFLDDSALEGVRLGYDASDNGLFQESLQDLEAAGAELVEIERDMVDLISLTEIPLIFNEFKFGINHYLANDAGPGLPVSDLSGIILYNQEHPEEVKYGQDLLIASDASEGNGDTADIKAIPTIEASRAAADRLFEDNDVDALIGPNAPYTNLGAAAGYPTVVVPAGYNNGDRPQGLSFFGPMWSEPELLGYAYAYEQVSQKRVPPEEVNPSLLDACTVAAPGADAGTGTSVDLMDLVKKGWNRIE